MPILRATDELRNAQLDALRGLVDALIGLPGRVKMYTGPQPPSAHSPLADQTLLATLNFNRPSAGPAQDGSLIFHPITEGVAPSSGKVSWARIEDGGEMPVFDCDVTGPGGGGVIEINTVDIAVGGPVKITSFILTAPAG